MIKIIIRLLTFIGSIAALIWNNNNFYFTSLSLFVGFLGTFIRTKKEASIQNTVTQKGGVFSQNTQNNYFSGSDGDNKK